MDKIWKFKIGLLCFISAGYLTNFQDILKLRDEIKKDFPGIQPGDLKLEAYMVGDSMANWLMFKPEDPDSIPNEYASCRTFEEMLEIICSD